MLKLLNKKGVFEKLALAALALILVSLAFNIRFLNSIFIMVLGGIVIFHPARLKKISVILRDPLVIIFFIFFLVQLAGFFYSSNPDKNIGKVLLKSGIVAIPIFFSFVQLPMKQLRYLMMIFTVCLFLACLFCLAYAFYTYMNTGTATVFFYHALIEPVMNHAVFYSFYIFFCFLYWMEEIRTRAFRHWIIYLVNTFFLIMIILLSSKLVIILSFIYMLFFCFKLFLNRARWMLPVTIIMVMIAVSLVVVTDNPVRQRFTDLASGNSSLFQQDKFSPDTYFNGLQFRLLMWRFTSEILNEHGSWFIGVTPGDAQVLLNSKYIEKDMYIGTPGRDTGFLGFNCHNLYLQSLLESGLIGLVIILTAVVLLARRIFNSKNKLAIMAFVSVMIFSLVESVLSTQYAIQVFIFFPLLFSMTARKL